MDVSGETLKRKHNEVNYENSAKKHPSSVPMNTTTLFDSVTPEMNNTDITPVEPQLICFEFLSNKNFKNFSWKIVREAFSLISSSWEFLSFRKDYTSCIIKVFDVDCIKKLIDIYKQLSLVVKVIQKLKYSLLKIQVIKELYITNSLYLFRRLK